MKKIDVNTKNVVSFTNNTFSCIGTGRMDLALHKEYLDQLALVQKEIGFDYIRGHGLFCKDMAIYQEREEADGSIVEEYNFTYLDQVMDAYRDLKLKPFIELGFMPEKLASGEETVFYWKGNITPPADYDKWTRLVQNTLRHLIRRYGEEEVLTWPIEVWNEPNLAVFWKNADKAEYFHLYEVSVKAVKEVNASLRVGGPAICGVDDVAWLTDFLEFVKEKKLPLDFVTRHHYTSEVPEKCGHYSYVALHQPEEAFEVLESPEKLWITTKNLPEKRFILPSLIPRMCQMRQCTIRVTMRLMSRTCCQGWATAMRRIRIGRLATYLRNGVCRLRHFTEDSVWLPTAAFRSRHFGHLLFIRAWTASACTARRKCSS